MRGYAWVPSCEEPYKLRGSMKAWYESVGPRDGKDWLCISYDAMMPIYSMWLSPSPISIYNWMSPTMSLSLSLCSLYLHLPPAGFPLPNQMVVVVVVVAVVGRSGSSCHNGLQVHLEDLSMGVSRCSSEYAWVPSAARLTVSIYIERLRLILHVILWCSKSCDCIKDEFDK